MIRPPIIRYRCPTKWGRPPTGLILMGTGQRTRRAYRVLSAKRAKSPSWIGLGVCMWRLTVERMSAAHGREEVAAGVPHWDIVWDRRG
jgi:hypothetical protein